METDIITRIKKSASFAVYGAHVVAYGVYTALRSLYNTTPECFIVSNSDGNPPEIDGVPVCTLNDCGLHKDTLILVAATDLFQDEICAALENNGFRDYIRIGSREEHLLMSLYFESIGKFPMLESSSNGAVCDLAVYEAKNHRDKPLVNAPALQNWEHSIQAGAEITDLRIAPLLDNTGINISHKNRMYSEMTVTFWVWKNTAHDWKGICHYRRHFVLTDGQIAALADGGVDAVLPMPYLCYPNTLTHFRRYVSKELQDTLLSALKALHPDKYEMFVSILNGREQYTYNLLIARREVFDDYCSWAFAVLEYMERSADILPEIKTTRALSYAAEVITSLYFLSNSDKLSIRHAEKRIYV